MQRTEYYVLEMFIVVEERDRSDRSWSRHQTSRPTTSRIGYSRPGPARASKYLKALANEADQRGSSTENGPNASI